MTSAPAIPLVFVELLADPQRRFAGLHWWHEDVSAAGLLPWLRDRSYLELARDLPCLWDEGVVARWPEALRDALALAPTQTVPAGALWRADSAFPAPLPPGARWVTGPWHLQPPAATSAEVTTSRARALQLLQRVAQDADTHELEDIFRQDAVMSYQLLRVVNSVALGGGRTITSFTQAILILGREPLRRWLNLLLFSARDDDPRSHLLGAQVALRARGLELLAQEAGFDRSTQDQAFMAGMFSLLGVLFGQPLATVLAPLHIGDDLRQALLEQRGDLGRLLSTWLAAEQGDAPGLRAGLAHWGVGAERFNTALLQACIWVCQLTREPGAPTHG